MKIEFSNDEKILQYRFDFQNKKIVFVGTSGKEIDYSYAVDYLTNFNLPDYEIRLLYKNNWIENEKHEVILNNGRVGMIFPLQTLLSDSNEFSKEDWFRNYSYVGLVKYLDQLDIKIDMNIDDFNPTTLFEAKDEQILIVETIKIKNYNFEDYRISLFSNGYSIKNNANIIECKNNTSKIIINSLSNDIKSMPIINYFSDFCELPLEPYFRFYTMYQIVEILINDVLDIEYSEAKKDLDKKDAYAYKKKVDELIREKYRIGKLVNKYSKIESDNINGLSDACDIFAKAYDIDNDENWYDKLYSVRNFIVHKLHGIDPNASEFEEINIYFVKILSDILSTYSRN